MLTDLTTEESKGDIQRDQNADRVEITYYTDPLCCWSWAFEPQWRRLQYEYIGKLTWKYCMGGLLPGWNNFNDAENSVSRPIQMGPVWMHASQVSGMPMNTRIWMEDAPASSYPACIAVKCAQLQSAQAAELYLRMLRQAIMLNGQNIAKQTVLSEVAEQLAKQQPTTFNINQFYTDLENENGLEAFRVDMNEVQTRGVKRFPTLILRQPSKPAIMMTGYRPYAALLEALQQVAPGIDKTRSATSPEEYARYWGSITAREVAEVAA